jgi:molybdopterin-containing oxidoreductase family iron-sulfur binding subunit
VRAFNWYDYQDERRHPELVTLHNQMNPDVTVRRRGVMEKCTFCIQRIHQAEDKAKAEGREVEDGEFTTACAQACPASAITFGRLDDPESVVNQIADANPSRGYHALDELRTQPRIRYLAGGV